MSKYWQVAAGSSGRDYSREFLKFGIAFVGGERHGRYCYTEYVLTPVKGSDACGRLNDAQVDPGACPP